jgi:hypothetical protein
MMTHVILLACLLILSMTLPTATHAETANEKSTAATNPIFIYRLTPYWDSLRLYFDAQTRIQLPKRVEDALLHEIPLTFTTQIEVRQSKTLAGVSYHGTLKEIHYETDLSYFNFNQKFLLMNQRNKKVKLFSSLEKALETLGTFERFPLLTLDDFPTLAEGTRYEVRMRIALNRWKLPAPLTLEALYLSDWDLDSGWVGVPIPLPNFDAPATTEALPKTP